MSQCCSVPHSQDTTATVCRICQRAGKLVDRITPENLLQENHAAQLQHVDYHFCPTESCDVVYFSNESEQYFTKGDVRVRVGLKENEGPIPVCYCFDFTRGMILDDIRRSGNSTASTYITEKVQAGECACEVKNPSGHCCLGEVNRVVQEGLHAYAGEAA